MKTCVLTLRAASYVLLATLIAGFVPNSSQASPCTGDCNVDAAVTVDELMRCVSIALEHDSSSLCTSCDQDNDGTVTIVEIVGAVGYVLAPPADDIEPSTCGAKFVEAASGVTDSATQVVDDSIRIGDFGYVGNVAGATGTAQGDADFVACFCPGGGTLQSVSCTSDATSSTFSAILEECASPGAVRSGSLTLEVSDPEFCSTCVIPVSAPTTQVFADGFRTAADDVGVFVVEDQLTEDFVLTAVGSCLRPGAVLANNRDSTLTGKIRVGPENGPQAVVDYQGFTTKVATTLDQRSLCRVTTIQDGRVSIDDAINDRRFTQTADNLVTTTTVLQDGQTREVTHETPAGGSLDVDCLGGPTQLHTLEPLIYPSFGVCATGGLLETRILGQTLITGTRYTATGGVQFDFGFDRGSFEIDEELASCRDADRCRAPVVTPTLAPTASPTPTSTPDVTATPTVTVAAGIVLSEDFERDDFWNDWAVDNGTWEWGVPNSGPGPAHQGQKLIATVLEGDYADNTASRLEHLIEFVVPATAQHPRLRFWHWYSFSCGDFGRVEIKGDSGNWEELATFSGYSGGTWGYPSLDLSSYAGQSVQLGFYFESHNDPCNRDVFGNDPGEVAAGWYIDELVVVTGTTAPLVPNTVEDFEGANFWDNWSVDNGTWEWGTLETGGPGMAHEGEKVIATVLNGDYGDNTSSRLVGPEFEVPNSGSAPRLRFWHWFSFSCGDFGRVEIKGDSGTWEVLATFSGYSGSTWGYPSLDLSSYAGQSVQLGFYFESHNDPCNRDVFGNDPGEVAAGWYIDELVVVTGPTAPLVPNTVEGFEGTSFWDNWSVDNGTWEWGTLETGGPEMVHEGEKLIATVLNGNYGDNTSSRLVTPKFVVPDAAQDPRLRLWHWFSFSCGDFGRVQIKGDTGIWEDLATFSGYSGGTWGYLLLDLRAYAGQMVQIGFYFESHNDPCNRDVFGNDPGEVGAGWYIDELVVATGPTAPLVPNTVEGFEGTNFWDNWSVDNGTWEWGTLETGGPEIAHEGEKVIATVLNGNYGDNTSSRLVSPEFEIPSAGSTPRLRFWHWYSFSCGDIGRVEIKGTSGTWQPLGEIDGNSGGTWSFPSFDLSPFTGQSVQLGFYFESQNHPCNRDVFGNDPVDVSSGWYIDELQIRN